ncbi:SUN domain-containing ossification factor isoform X2 [Anabrus simplex]|uniref:SUN domain-containing ossification factor isoform X2 n=2 Tax=Anabrus simplex TaxID=316456 RepID=UPI0035A368BF
MCTVRAMAQNCSSGPMAAPVCSLKQLASPARLSATYDSRGFRYWGRRASYRLLQMALLYLTVLCITWAFPPLYDRLSETSQAVVFTLVDSASVELQQQVSPASQQTDNPGVKVTKNSSSASTPSTINLPPAVDEVDVANVKEYGLADNLSVVVENQTDLAPEEQYVVRAEPKIITKEELAERKPPTAEPVADVKPEVLPEESLTLTNGSSSDTSVNEPEPSDHATPPEDIPSFSEWAQKQLAEAEEKQKVAVNTNGSSAPTASSSRAGGALKLRSKNYASPDCGAKIVATNPEAASASSVLSPSRDEYLLNTCTSRIWFVVELCEAIQAKKIELANFELFSSSPREFSVSVSDRIQTRDWQSVGHFTAEDERNIQSFTLHPQLFGKYIKVEFHSHYGSEHFCPVSLFRVYGTSEFEVLERVDEVHESVLDMDEDDDDDVDGALDIDTGEPPKNLFNSAKDAVMSIVKKAAEALGKGGDVQNDTSLLNTTSEETALEIPHMKFCKSPRHIVVCDNCSDSLFSDVYQLLSCEETSLQILMSSPFVYDVIRDGQLCSKYGLFFSNRRAGAPYPLKQTEILVHPKADPSDYISALFPPQYIAALCNMLAIYEKRVALNISEEPNITTTITISLEEKNSNFQEHGFENVVLPPASTCSADNSAASQACSTPDRSEDSIIELATTVPTTEPYSVQDKSTLPIKPTKTLTDAKQQDTFPSPTDSGGSLHTKSLESEAVPSADAENTVSSVVTATSMLNGKNKTQVDTPDLSVVPSGEASGSSASMESKDDNILQGEGIENVSDIPTEEQPQDTLDRLLKDLKDLDQAVGSSSSSMPVASTSSSAPVPPPNVPPAQQVQKESVFLRLANRIKALERNMSLSGQYLEELSRRYKKQMEEMQRAFNRTLAALGEESRKGHEREQKRMEEMLALQQQLTTLSSVVEVLLEEREGWMYKANVLVHHVILITVEVIICVWLLYYCRRNLNPADMNDDQRRMNAWRTKKNSKTGGVKRRKSVDGVCGHESPKTRCRRPSEEALNIAGTYHDLLITEEAATEVDGGTRTVPKGESKRRRRKKKEFLLKSPSATIIPKRVSVPSSVNDEQLAAEPARRASSSDVPTWWTASNGVGEVENELSIEPQWERQQSVPETACSNFLSDQSHVEELTSFSLPPPSPPPSTPATVKRSSSDLGTGKKQSVSSNKSEVQVIEIRTKRVSTESAPGIIQNNGLVKSPPVSTTPILRHVTSPSFMRTAISSRSGRRNSGIIDPFPQAKLKSDNWEWYSSRHNVSSQRVQLPCTSVPLGLNGQMESEDSQRTSSFNNISSGSEMSRKDSNKRGSSGGLKKMVKKFF